MEGSILHKSYQRKGNNSRDKTDELLDLMHLTNQKENFAPKDLRLQVLLKFVRKNLRQKLRKKQLRLQRQINRDKVMFAALIKRKQAIDVQQANSSNDSHRKHDIVSGAEGIERT